MELPELRQRFCDHTKTDKASCTADLHIAHLHVPGEKGGVVDLVYIDPRSPQIAETFFSYPSTSTLIPHSFRGSITTLCHHDIEHRIGDKHKKAH
jgi:hypothetical protein